MGYVVSFLAGALGFSIFDKTTETKSDSGLSLGNLAIVGGLLLLGLKLYKKIK